MRNVSPEPARQQPLPDETVWLVEPDEDDPSVWSGNEEWCQQRADGGAEVAMLREWAAITAPNFACACQGRGLCLRCRVMQGIAAQHPAPEPSSNELPPF
jgi:hypothetical protein